MDTTHSELPVVVGGAIVNAQDQPCAMLVARRKAPKSLAGYWEFPGGKVESGETQEQALVRELQEELGVTVQVGDLIVSEHPDGWLLDNGMRMQVYTAHIISGDPVAMDDHDILDWVPLNSTDLHALEWIPADRPIVDALLEQLKRNVL